MDEKKEAPADFKENMIWRATDKIIKLEEQLAEKDKEIERLKKLIGEPCYCYTCELREGNACQVCPLDIK